MSTITFRTAWRKADKEIERDAIAFWQKKGNLLPAQVSPEARARQLCAVAYRDGEPVGVSTATIEFVPQFRMRMAAYRCAVDIGLRRQPLSWSITEYSRDLLEQWSAENPDEKVMGLMAVFQARELIMRYPEIVAPVNMAFCGFTPHGFPIRVAWFKHAQVPTEWPPRRLQQGQPGQTQS